MSSIQDLAVAIGSGRQTVYVWRRMDGFPGGESGPWDPAAVRAWRDARPNAHSRQSTPGRRDARTRLEEAKATKAELEVEKLRGELVPRDAVHRMLVSRCQDLRRSVRDVPRTLCDRCRAIMLDRIDTALDAFVRRAGLAELLQEDDEP